MKTVVSKFWKIRYKQTKVMRMKASYKFRLSALAAINNTVSENWMI